MKTSIGISKSNRQAVALELSKIMADEFVLYTKTRNAHWNIEGPDFMEKHVFFESQYEQLATIIDDIAERIRIIGHYAPATLKQFLELTHLTEASRAKNNSKGFIGELLADHQSICIRLRENIIPFADKYKDAGTSDFVTNLLGQHEKIAWMLRMHL